MEKIRLSNARNIVSFDDKVYHIIEMFLCGAQLFAEFCPTPHLLDSIFVPSFAASCVLPYILTLVNSKHRKDGSKRITT